MRNNGIDGNEMNGGLATQGTLAARRASSHARRSLADNGRTTRNGLALGRPASGMPPPPSDLVAVYCRVSTDEQQEAQTIRNQLGYAERWTELNGLRAYDFYQDDGVSGTIPLERRPGGSRLL